MSDSIKGFLAFGFLGLAVVVIVRGIWPGASLWIVIPAVAGALIVALMVLGALAGRAARACPRCGNTALAAIGRFCPRCGAELPPEK